MDHGPFTSFIRVDYIHIGPVITKEPRPSFHGIDPNKKMTTPPALLLHPHPPITTPDP